MSDAQEDSEEVLQIEYACGFGAREAKTQSPPKRIRLNFWRAGGVMMDGTGPPSANKSRAGKLKKNQS